MFKRTFVAIKINPAEEMIRRIYYLQDHLKHDHINWIKTENLHITLKFIGNTPVELIENIGIALQQKLQNKKGFNIGFFKLGVFGSHYQPKVIWYNTNQIDIIKQLALDIQNVMDDFGFYSDRQNFVPHLSIARIRKINDKNYFFNVINSFEEGIVHQESVKRIVFFESILTQRGAIYKPLKEIELML